MERARIFNNLDPNSEMARRRTIGMSAERKEAQRMSRIHIAMHSPVLSQSSATSQSPAFSLRSMFSETPITPIEEINGFGSFPTPVPLQSMSLLPVKDLTSSVAFYAKVLGFNVVSNTSGVQTVMSSSAATICLRASQHAPPSTTGTTASRMSMSPASAIDPLSNGLSKLPTMTEESSSKSELWLPPTPESINLACTDPEPLNLPSASLPPSPTNSAIPSTTVLIEYSGALESMHSLISARLNEWRLERSKLSPTRTQGDSARLLGGVQQTPWDAQELHLCDLDGHRIVFTSPFVRTALGPSLI